MVIGKCTGVFRRIFWLEATTTKPHHQIQRIREPYCTSFKLLSTKMWNFVFFARRQDIGSVFICLFFCFFSRGDRIDPVVVESYDRAHSNGNALFKRPKNWRAPRPPPTLIIFLKSPDQRFWDSHFIQRSRKPLNYVFGDDLLPHSPRGRGYKLQTLTSVYI